LQRDLSALRPGGGAFATADASSGGLDVYVFAAGQADALLLVGPTGRTALVDMGEPMSGQRRPFEQVAQRIKEITGGAALNYFVLSHYHSDHVGGANSGLAGLMDSEGFTFETVIDPGDINADKLSAASRGTYRTYIDNLNRWLAGGKVGERKTALLGAAQINLGPGVSVDLLAVGGRYASGGDALAAVESANPGIYDNAPASENDLSIALEVSFGEFELFTAGDLTGADYSSGTPPAFTPRSYGGGNRQTYTNVESPLVAAWRAAARENDVEVYRANHHGSAHSSTPELVAELDPEFIIYSCGGGYDHPDRKIAQRGAATAWQYVTSGVSRREWNPLSDFGRYGEVIGEVQIRVTADGGWYTINNELHRAYTDSAEEGSATPAGSGEDKDEHTWYWTDEL
jgi:hypothetical protein